MIWQQMHQEHMIFLDLAARLKYYGTGILCYLPFSTRKRRKNSFTFFSVSFYSFEGKGSRVIIFHSPPQSPALSKNIQACKNTRGATVGSEKKNDERRGINFESGNRREFWHSGTDFVKENCFAMQR